MIEPIAYMERTRAYYQALGYGTPYVWAKEETVPFTRCPQLNRAEVAIVTTAAPYQPDAGDQGPGAPYNGAAKFYRVYELPVEPAPDLRISHVAIDRIHTTAEDPATYFPLASLGRAVAAGRVGAMSPSVYGLPTNRSQRQTRQTDCPDLVARLVAGCIDAVVFVPNCPVCHQSCALAACAVEAAGIPSVIMGCAFDILEHVGAPRCLVSDFPLGNSAGIPHDQRSQDATLALALDLLENADASRSLRWSPLIWPGPENWRDDYSNPAKLGDDDIAAKRAEFDKGKSDARALRENSTLS